MTGKTYPQLTAATTIEATDILATYRSPGPLKQVSVTILTDYLRAALPAQALAKDVSATSYTLTNADAGYTIFFTAATAVTVTVPAGLVSKFECAVVQWGTGTVTFLPSSTTVNQSDGLLSIAAQYGTAALIGKSTDVFVLAGQLA